MSESEEREDDSEESESREREMSEESEDENEEEVRCEYVGKISLTRRRFSEIKRRILKPREGEKLFRPAGVTTRLEFQKE